MVARTMVQKVEVADGRIVAAVSGDIPGIVVPGPLVEVPVERLRLIGGVVVDASDLTRFHVDDRGYKHAEPAIGRQEIACSFNAEVEPDGAGGWLLVDMLARLKGSLKAGIDAEAERQRLRWITPGAGQAMTYARKVDQAKAALAATNPQPEDYPMLAASIGIDGANLVEVATLVLEMDAAWEVVGAAIEGARLGAKRAIDAALNEAAARSVAPNWPSA